MKLTQVFRKYGLRAAAAFLAVDFSLAAIALAGGAQLMPKQERADALPVMRLQDRVAAVRFAADPEHLFTPRATHQDRDPRTITTDGDHTYKVVMVSLK